MSGNHRTTEQKLVTKIRLLIAGLTHRKLFSSLHESDSDPSPWHPRMTMIPSEWDRPLAEVRAEVNRRFERGEDTVVAPVLREPTAGRLSISVLFISCKESSDIWAVNVTDTPGDLTMGHIADVLARNKKWDIRDIEEPSGLNRLLDMA